MGSLLLLVLLLHVLQSELVLQDLVALEFGIDVESVRSRKFFIFIFLRTRESIQEVLRQLNFQKGLNKGDSGRSYIAFLEVRSSPGL